jgi:hypothetical protein
MPTHAIGDLIMVYAYRSGSTTAPTTPASSGWNLVCTATGSTNIGILSVKIATTTAEVTGTWTNATGIDIIVVSGHAGMGASATGTGASATITYPALTLVNTDGSSAAFRFAGHSAATNMTTNAPSTAPNTFVVGTATRITSYWSNGGTGTSPTSGTQSVSTSGNYAAVTVEVMGASSGGSAAFQDLFTSDTFDTTVWQTVATGGVTFNTTSATDAVQIQQINFSAGSGWMATRTAFDLTGRSAWWQFVAVSSGAIIGLMSMGVTPGTTLTPLSGVTVSIDGSFNATAKSWTNGVATSIGATTPATSGTWFRFRESGGTVFIEKSSDGSVWSAFQSTATAQLPMNWRLFGYCAFTSAGGSTMDDAHVSAAAITTPTNLFFRMF